MNSPQHPKSVSQPTQERSVMSKLLGVLKILSIVGIIAILGLSKIRGVGQPSGSETFHNPTTEELLHARYDRFFNTSKEWERVASLKKQFMEKNGGKYGYSGKLDEIVAHELRRFDGNVYVDYTGAGVYQEKQISEDRDDLISNMYGNAHSRSKSALHTEEVVEKVRKQILKHFHTSSKDYHVIFTSGATGALKIVGESFPWTNNSKFAYLRSNHNSVLGIREIALDQGAQFVHVSSDELSADRCSATFGGWACHAAQGAGESRKKVLLTKFPDSTYNLFAFPAQDNFAGVKYPLEWINQFKSKQFGEKGTGKWLTLLDAAAYVPCNDLNLTKYPADFVSISFYKMFGFPTGTGVLLVRNEVADIMQKTYFAGGNVISSTCDAHFCLLASKPCSRFEDGTINFLSISALRHGLKVLNELGMDSISKHVWSVTKYTYEQLSSLRHSTGKPLLEIFGNHEMEDPLQQGGIVSIRVMDKNGNNVGYRSVQDASAEYGIHLRTGCNCNPGACYGYLGLTSEEVMRFALEKSSCGDEHDIIEGKALGAVRVSFGYLSTFEDATVVVDFFKTLLQ
eukprot:TRINITY_DN2481_c0_g1_i1.p1 TRINITY_DN2481_c0_g1~~TRINITY_DN2481_c0_g1_i1.p1  ORF type:complete len:579 (+),score=100.46 TRINITY_DN2481_c0_g1_i1:32-1738(+)